MKKINVGIIGIGNMGKNHARVYSEIATVAAISDVNESLGREIAERYHAIFYNNYNQMFDEQKLDAVSVVVPTFLHEKIVIDCLKRGIPTLVEKPIAANTKEASTMQKYSEKYQTLLLVGHVERFNPALIKLKEIIEEKRLGKILNLLAIRVGIAPPKSAASDVAVDLGIHDVDVFNYLLGKYPDKKKVIKTKLFSKSTADASTLFLEYGSTTGVIQTNWVTPVKMRKLFISGVEGYAELDYIQQKLVLYDKILNTRFDGSFYELVSLSSAPKKEVFVSKKEPLKEELLYFIKNRKNFRLNNLADAIQALKIVS